MQIDYQELGQRIRRVRRQKRMTQETLAELADISATHMSHIETGSTKVSLPALLQLANALGCSADELLCDSLTAAKPVFLGEMGELLSDCTETETKALVEIAKTAKRVLRGM